MTAYEDEVYRAHFGRYASLLEKHLTSNGVSCNNADMIIEESSVFYFNRIRSTGKSFLKFLKKQTPSDIFVESACKAIEKHIPEAMNTFCSHSEISKCIR
jgi:hypothetical protein